MPFSWLAAGAGLPLGLAMGWCVYRLILAWPAGHALWRAAPGAPPSRFAHSDRAAGARVRAAAGRHARPGHAARRMAAFTIGAVAAGTVLLGWSHPAPDWAGWSQSVLLWGLLFALAAIDLRALLVDLRLVALGIALRLLSLLLWERAALLDMAAGLLIGAGFFHILELFYEVLRGRRGLGEGDAAVAGLVGAFVGWQGLLALVALSALTGLAVGLPWLLAARKPLATPIPFAPFLCGAGMAVYLAELHGWTGERLLFPML